jgi:hypothetical protein
LVHIFVSYRWDDAPGYAGRLSDALAEVFGENCVYRDVNRLTPGRDFTKDIERALSGSDVLVAVIGRGWLKSGRDTDDFVRQEIARALELDMPIVPALVDRATMPGTRALSPAIAKFATRQALELVDSRWPEDVRRLAQRIESLAQSARRQTIPEVEVLKRSLFQRLFRVHLRHESHTIKVQHAGAYGAWIELDGVKVLRDMNLTSVRFEVSDGQDTRECDVLVASSWLLLSYQIAIAIDGYRIYDEKQ